MFIKHNTHNLNLDKDLITFIKYKVYHQTIPVSLVFLHK